MSQVRKDIVLFAKETVRGTIDSGAPPAPFVLHQPFLGDGLVPALSGNLAEIKSSTGWPNVTEQLPMGVTASLVLTPDINVATIQSLIKMGIRLTSGKLQSVTIRHGRSDVSTIQYLGCVANQMSLEYSRSGTPDGASLLSGSINFEAMKVDNNSPDAVAGTQGGGLRFNMARSTFTINGVPALEVLSYSRSITNTLVLGPLDSGGKRLFIEDGEVAEDVKLTARFTTAAWTDLVANATEHAVTIVHATGGTDQTVTETMAKVQIESHELSKQDGMVIEQITIKPFYPGAADATVWAFGTGIGADPLTI